MTRHRGEELALRDPRLGRRVVTPDMFGPEERYGIVHSAGARGVRPASSSGLGNGAAARSADRGSASGHRYSLLAGDPYEQVARDQQDMGRRLPSSFDTPSAQAGQRSLTGKLPAESRIYQDLRNDRSVYNAGSVAGMHESFAGSYGAMGSDPYNWDARHRFGYGPMQSRGVGYSDRWDTAQGKERTAGRLTETGKFDQAVQFERPYLQLRARSIPQAGVVQAEGTYEGNALVRLTTGNFQDGQGVQSRTFWIGGGLVAAFDLQGWNNVHLNLLELMDDTFVEFAWTREGLHGESRALYFPQTYTTGATSSPVPEGAYALLIENPSPAVPGTTVTLEWTGQIGGAVFTFSQMVSDNSPVAFPRPYWYFGIQIPAMAPTFRVVATAGAPATMGATIDIVWLLRPI